MRRAWVGMMLGAALTLAAPGGAAAQSFDLEIDGLPGDGMGFGQGWAGAGGFGTIGQTFTVPWGVNSLDGFAFHLLGPWWTDSPYEPFLFRAYLMRWDADAAQPFGPVLFRSDPLEGIRSDAERDYYRTAFDPGTWLRSGAMYVAFLSSVEHPVPLGPGQLAANAVLEVWGDGEDFPFDPYEGGDLVGVDSGPGLEGLTGGRWTVYANSDARFEAHFSTSTVPEPASMALLGSGLAGLAGWAKRRRRREPADA